MGHQPDNIPAGTQVVSSVPIRGTNDALVHPRGAVGIITRTPTGEENHYLVRFPDGFVNALTREEFDILKHFKDRVPGVASASTDSPEFDLDQFVIYRCVSGSRAYGLETDDSDTDLRGVYLAPAELQWSLFGAPDQFEDSARQWVVWELQKFLVMALKANPNILECLYSPLVEKEDRARPAHSWRSAVETCHALAAPPPERWRRITRRPGAGPRRSGSRTVAGCKARRVIVGGRRSMASGVAPRF